jgi:pyruvate carboxylase subunit B
MKNYKFTINDQKYEARIVSYDGSTASVVVNGVEFSVEIDNEASQSTPRLVRSEKSAPAVPSYSAQASMNEINAPIPGIINSVNVKIGDDVKEGQILFILEAMKMEQEIASPVSGTIKELPVKQGDSVTEGQLLVKLEGVAAPAPVKKQPVKKSTPKHTPAPKPAPAAPAGGKVIETPMPGTIVDVLVKVGDTLAIDDPIAVIEAMKMEQEITTHYAGTVKKVLVSKGESITEGQILIEVE